MPHLPVVLIVEDQNELRQVLRDVLDEEGYDVLPVSDPTEAMAILREQSVDLLVSDLSESEDEGLDPLADVTREFPELPLIVLSDNSPDTVPFFGPWRISGSRMTLRKPFRLDDLIAASREVIG
jgi:CheY-like chemotaxis protein